MYSGSLGKVGNCQIGVSVHAVTDWASAAIDWRLFLPKSWDDTTTDDPEVAQEVRARRARSKIPDGARHREKWRQALDMLDEIIGRKGNGPVGIGDDGIGDEQGGGWGLDPRPVVADAGYGDCTEFRCELDARGLPYVLAVKATTSAYPAQAEPVTPPYTGRGRPPVPRYRDAPSTLAAVALAAGRRALRRVTWRHGTRTTAGNPTAAMASRFLALRVRQPTATSPEPPTAPCPSAG